MIMSTVDPRVASAAAKVAIAELTCMKDEVPPQSAKAAKRKIRPKPVCPSSMGGG